MKLVIKGILSETIPWPSHQNKDDRLSSGRGSVGIFCDASFNVIKDYESNHYWNYETNTGNFYTLLRHLNVFSFTGEINDDIRGDSGDKISVGYGTVAGCKWTYAKINDFCSATRSNEYFGFQLLYELFTWALVKIRLIIFVYYWFI